MHSARRGMGSDVAGSRPYRPGDDIDTIDWGASARLSAASASDVFIVRERYAEEAPYVVCVCDRRPEMSFFQAPLPWLRKPQAMQAALELIVRSAVGAHGFVGYVDHADGELYWQPPQSEHRLLREAAGRLDRQRYGAPADAVPRALAHLEQHRRSLPAGTFVFCLSDFLQPPSDEEWLQALEQRWDVVPVVIQDPVWEQNFPDVAGIGIPFADPVTGRVATALLNEREVTERRAANEERRRLLLESFDSLDLEPVLVSSHDPGDVLGSFLTWAEHRLYRRGRPW